MKKKTPPFEVMRTRIAQPSRPYVKQPVHMAEADDDSIDEGWLAHARRPLVLRLPRGQAAAIVGVLLLVVVLAYGVGLAQGKRAGAADARRLTGDLSGGVSLLPDSADMVPRVQGETVHKSAAQASPNRGHETAQFVSNAGQTQQPAAANQSQSIRRASSDPREPGLNYFVLAHYPLEDAGRLKLFLEQQGVPCVILSTARSDQYQVQALNGFLREELKSAEFNAFREKVIRLGYIWKTEHRGPTDLSGCYAQLYKPAAD